MDKAEPPETFGVFKPVDHTVAVFRSAAEREAAEAIMLSQGVESAAMVRYTPSEMMALVDRELPNAGMLASFGYELDLIKTYRAQAQDGCSFLVVHAPDPDAARQVADVVRSVQAVAAQHYGTFMIEDLLAPTPGASTTDAPPRRDR